MWEERQNSFPWKWISSGVGGGRKANFPLCLNKESPVKLAADVNWPYVFSAEGEIKLYGPIFFPGSEYLHLGKNGGKPSISHQEFRSVDFSWFLPLSYNLRDFISLSL